MKKGLDKIKNIEEDLDKVVEYIQELTRITKRGMPGGILSVGVTEMNYYLKERVSRLRDSLTEARKDVQIKIDERTQITKMLEHTNPKDKRMIKFLIILPNKTYAIVVARNREDAQERTLREFGTNGWEKIIPQGEPPKGHREVSYSPIEVSYGGYKEDHLPKTSKRNRTKGNVEHTEIRSRNEYNLENYSEETNDDEEE